jgi:Leucine-rich repeat (LRR) protein
MAISYSGLIQPPTNLNTLPCFYILYSLDLSGNQIDTLGPLGFACGASLTTLNLAANVITGLDERAFDQLVNLATLDLSNNRLTSLPVYLFANKLPRLKYLYLHFNSLVVFDSWYFTLKSIQMIDLHNNQIIAFTNQLNFTVSTQGLLPPSFLWAKLIDLRNNRITKFDDSTLSNFFKVLSVIFNF